MVFFPDVQKVEILPSEKYPEGRIQSEFPYYCERQILDLKEREQYGLSESCKDMAYIIMAVMNDGADRKFFMMAYIFV